MIGKTLAHYEILERIGAGGMGDVYRARDTKLGREVALKVLPSQASSRPGFQQRFEQEARTIATLNHPNIVTIHSTERDGDTSFLTMEIVRGKTLSEILKDGTLPLDAFFKIAVPLVSALSAVHDHGITHRDLKPGNVMVSTEGQVKLLDFGIAKIAESFPETTDSATAAFLTQPGEIVGTVPYMSPEQIQGKPFDSRSDVFSLGIIFYEMLAGTYPFSGENPIEIVTGILRDNPPPIPSLDDSLEYVLRRCLEKTPEGRWDSMATLGTRLEDLRARTGVRLDGTSSEDPGIPEGVAELLKNGSWKAAFDLLSEASVKGELSPVGQEHLADAAFWLNLQGVCTQALEAAHTGHVELGDIEGANRTAVMLAELHIAHQFRSVGNGWLMKAERGLKTTPDSPTWGYLERVKARIAFEQNHEVEKAWAHATRALEIARRVEDRNLESLAIQDQGRALVAMGKASEGMALLDEAMAAALSGELSPRTVGATYCNMIATCKQVADYRRAGEWSASGEQWCESVSDSAYPGICQVHRAEVMRLRGAWEDAEAHIVSACQRLGETSFSSSAAFYELGEMQFRRGEFAEAEKAFLKAHRLGRDPVPGLALLRFAQGKQDAAIKMIDRALREDLTVSLDRAKLLPTQVDMAVAVGNLDAAGAAADELDSIAAEYPYPAFAARAAQARGTLALGAEQYEEASRHLRQAVKLWRECELPHDEARSRVLLARGYRNSGNLEDAKLELNAARETFEVLGAVPDLEALRELEQEA